MRHRKKVRKLNKPADQRKAMLRSLVRSLILNESVKTTLPRAREAAKLADRLVTWGKRGDVHSRRLALRVIPEPHVIAKLFEDIAPRYEDIDGGYARVIRAGLRRGDSAEMALLRWRD
ncbi:MAG: 50S ribosomal protein L17 [Armatimonadetes bacterium]|nr:50S ribosomal protein L17 [Armatimonadota bacterium]